MAIRTRLAGLAASSHALSLVALLSQALTLAVQFAVARRFGLAGTVDAWTAAMAPAALLATLLTALAGQLVLPALARAREEGGEAAEQRARAELLTAFGIAGGLAGGLLALLAQTAVALFAPGLAEPSRVSAEELLRLLGLGLLPAGANAVLAHAAHARGRFLGPAALEPLAAGASLAAFFLAQPESALHTMLAVQAATAWARTPLLAVLAEHRLRGGFARPGPASRALLRRAWPLLLIAAAVRVNQAVDTFFASSLAAGQLAALGYATRAVAIVQAVLAAPVATVVFVSLSEQAVRADWPAFRASVARACERGLFLSVGAALLLVALGREAAALLLGLPPEAAEVEALASCLAALSGILVFAVWGSVLTRACLAAQLDGVAVLFLGVLPMLLNLVLDAALVGRFGVTGLAAVTSLNALIGLPLVAWLLQRRGLVPRGLYRTAARFLACALPPGLLLLLAPAPGEAGLPRQLLHITGLAGLGALAYALLVARFGGGLRRLLRGA